MGMDREGGSSRSCYYSMLGIHKDAFCSDIHSAYQKLALVRCSKAGLSLLVEYNDKNIFEVRLKEMKSTLTTQLAEEVAISEVIETVKQHVKDAKLPDIEIV
ncbi:hypothetical protein FXO38_06844 [Capsicum annuum]|nr:hypothetical protein FXO38_06844 [Capsicum annuum]